MLSICVVVHSIGHHRTNGRPTQRFWVVVFLYSAENPVCSLADDEMLTRVSQFSYDWSLGRAEDGPAAEEQQFLYPAPAVAVFAQLMPT